MRQRRTGRLQRYDPASAAPLGIRAPHAQIPNLPTNAPGQLEGLRDAAINTGGIVTEALGREYFRDQTARVDDAVLEASRKFELWKAAYNEENRGRAGIQALQDYQAKFGEIRKEAEEAFDGADNEIFRDLLSSKLAERGLHAIREGASFQSRQKEEWLASQLAAQLADFGSYAAGNPDDEEGIARRRASLMASWHAKNPGLDPGATAARLNGEEFSQRMEGYIASGDLAAARRLLSAHGKLAGLNRASSLSDWLIAHNNPGSVTVDGRNFAAYATPRDGIAAIMGRFAAYHKRGLTTPAKIIGTYAPPSENDTKAYIAQVAASTGLDPDKPIDVRDPATLAAMAGAVMRQEHSLNADPAELMAAARQFLEKGEPKAVGVIHRDRGRRQFLPGFDPASFQRYQERLRLLEHKEAAEQDQARAELILEEIRQLPMERRSMELLRVLEDMPIEERERMRPLLKVGVESRKELDRLALTFSQQDAFSRALAAMPRASDTALEAMAMSMASDIGDPGVRENFRNFALNEIEQRRKLRAANDAAQLEAFMQAHQGQTPGEIRAAIASSGLSTAMRQRAADLSWGLARDESPANVMATSLALSLRDAGLLDNESELESFASQNALTLAQVKQIRDYQGNARSVTIQRVNGLLKALNAMGDFDGPDQIDARAYRVLLERLKPGREPTDQELSELLTTLYISDGSWFFKRTLMDELAKEQFNMDWLPEVKSWQRPELEQILRQQGIEPTENNLRLLLKLNIFHEQGWKIDNSPEWE